MIDLFEGNSGVEMAEFKDVLFSNSMEIMAFRFFFSFFDQAKIEMEDVSFVR